jgi:hypothetical protein
MGEGRVGANAVAAGARRKVWGRWDAGQRVSHAQILLLLIINKMQRRQSQRIRRVLR